MADLTSAKEEYQQFLNFIRETPDDLRKELCYLVYAFYVHIYVLYLKKNKNVEGQEFLSAYKHLFDNSQGVTDNLKTLCELQCIEEFSKHSYFKQFLESDYTIALSEESLSHLRSYFEKTECKILFSIFRKCVFVNRKSSYHVPAINLHDLSGLGISEFNEIVKKIKECLNPFTYIYKVVAPGRNLCAVDINSENTQLTCGFENSTIHVWNLSSNFLKVKGHTSEDFEYVSLAVNSKEEFLANDGKKLSVPGTDKMLSGHTGDVFGIVNCPNNFLVSCSADGTVRTWDMVSFKAISMYTGFAHPVWDVAVSPDGELFASASKDARLWSFQYQLPLNIFEDHFCDVDCVTFHPNSRYIATAAADNKIKIWSKEQKRAVQTIFDNITFQSCIAFSPNGCHLASADDNGRVKIFDVRFGRILKEFQAHSSRILSISYNKQGSLLATGGFDKYLSIWNIQCTQREVLSKPVISHFTGEVVQLVKFLNKDLLVSVI